MALALPLARCTAPLPNYGVGNGLQGRAPPLGPGVSIPDSSVIPPGILDAACDNMPNCSVSWTSDIFPNMASTGPWQCASATCHGGATPPAIHDGDPTGAYAALATYVGSLPTPFIVPCDSNANDSSMVCNLTPGGCGDPMPIGSGTPLSASDLATVQTWVECGEPLN
jgi:hypothetical protein